MLSLISGFLFFRIYSKIEEILMTKRLTSVVNCHVNKQDVIHVVQLQQINFKLFSKYQLYVALLWQSENTEENLTIFVTTPEAKYNILLVFLHARQGLQKFLCIPN